MVKFPGHVRIDPFVPVDITVSQSEKRVGAILLPLISKSMSLKSSRTEGFNGDLFARILDPVNQFKPFKLLKDTLKWLGEQSTNQLTNDCKRCRSRNHQDIPFTSH